MHTHNQLLQAAIDLGWPGLIAHLALGWAPAYAPLAARRTTADLDLRAVTVGRGAGLVAEFRYGLTDVITFGARFGIGFWLPIAQAVSLYQVTGVGARLGAVDEPAD